MMHSQIVLEFGMTKTAMTKKKAELNIFNGIKLELLKTA